MNGARALLPAVRLEDERYAGRLLACRLVAVAVRRLRAGMARGTGTGLVTAGQLRFPEDGGGPRRRGRARVALDVSLKARRDGGLYEPVDEALCGLLRIGFDELDRACRDPATSAHTRALLLGRCGSLYAMLFERGGDGADGLEDLYAALRDGTQS